VVEFHHVLGNRVEWEHPELGDVPELATLDGELLPFLALPDGAHLVDSGRVVFALPPRRDAGHPTAAVYGVACFGQLKREELTASDDAVTRSHVQKAVCVLTRGSPLLSAHVFAQLAPATAAWFAQRDFGQRQILQDCFVSLQASLTVSAAATATATASPSSPPPLTDGTTALVRRLGPRNVLALVKLALAGSRVVVACCGRPNGAFEAGEVVLLIISLVPMVLQSPPFTEAAPTLTERQRAFGSPWRGEALLKSGSWSSWSPYAAVQQVEALQRKATFFVGATNALFLPQSNVAHADAVFNVATNELSLLTPQASQLAQLTSADRRFADALFPTAYDEEREGIEWEGGDDWLRAQFVGYLERLVCCIVVANATPTPEARDMVAEFGQPWVDALLRTHTLEVSPESAGALKALCPAAHPGGPSPLQELGKQIGEYVGMHLSFLLPSFSLTFYTFQIINTADNKNV